jgi:NAD(P)H-hydrate epimerase
MTWPLPASGGQISAKGLTASQFSKLVAQKTVIAVGPGLGQGGGTAKLVSSLLADTAVPTVIDADALNAIGTHPHLLAKLAEVAKAGRTIVLTPHPGEMARLTGKSVAEIQANRLEAARSFACEYGVTMVLKGSRTLIAHPDGSAAVNTTGNPAMAKAGSGDMLTGLIAGMLAQFKNDVASAVEVAVYLHGMAADFAVRDSDEHTLLATDSLNYYFKAFRFRPFRFYRGAPRGYVWLQGLPAAAVPVTRSQEAAE